MRTLSSYISQIRSLLRDDSSGVVDDNDIKEALNRGIRYLINECGVYATKSRTEVSLFPGIYEYALPSDFHDPITLNERGDPINFERVTPSEFWLRLREQNQIFSIDTRKGSRYLLTNYTSAGSRQDVHNCDSVTANGTWSVGDDGAGLVADSVVSKSGSSLKFNADVSASGNDYVSISNSDMTAVDLSDFDNGGTMFVSCYLPETTYITGMTMRWGSDASNYEEVSVTTQYDGGAFETGWNQLGFNWTDATQTGTPDTSNIDYVYFQITYSSSQTDVNDFRIDDIWMGLPSKLELFYYSRDFVQTSGGTAQQVFSSSSDETLLADEDDDVLFWYALADGNWIFDRMDERDRAQLEFEKFVDKLKSRYASERSRESIMYY